jgi:hypothetical protein
MFEAYRIFDCVDVVCYLDVDSVVCGHFHYNIVSQVPPGFDIGAEYRKGEKPYDRFGTVGPAENPERRPKWSPTLVIALDNELVSSAQTPVYRNGKLAGKVSMHYNMRLLRDKTIKSSQSALLLLSKHGTIIGMSPRAASILPFGEYTPRQWPSKTHKSQYLENELNIHRTCPEIAPVLTEAADGEWFDLQVNSTPLRAIKQSVRGIDIRVVRFG